MPNFWPFVRRKKLEISNALLIPEYHKERLQEMLAVVEKTTTFRNLRGDCRVSTAEIISAEQITQDYVVPGRRRGVGGDWPKQLAAVIADRERTGVIGVQAFESQRDGTQVTFFVDPETMTLLFELKSSLAGF